MKTYKRNQQPKLDWPVRLDHELLAVHYKALCQRERGERGGGGGGGVGGDGLMLKTACTFLSVNTL